MQSTISRIRRMNPGKKVIRTAASLGLRLGVDEIPASMLRRRQVVLPLVIKKGPVEPYWVRATTPQPPLVLQDVLFGKTPVGTFLHREWARFKRSVAEEQHKYNRVPEGTIRNPFLPWFNPVTRTFAPPIYNLRKQQVLQTECRRLGLTDVLPSGKKTPEGFANTTITAWTMKGPEGAKERVDLGQITWSGDYVKRVNPWGAGRFTPERLSAAELEARKVPGTDLDPWGAYAGRKIMFKGSLAERNKPKRQAAIDARMKDMPKRIATWKKEVLANKIKARPALPF